MAGEKHAYSGQSAAKLQALVIIKASEWTVELEEKLAVVPAWAAEGIVPSVKDALSSGVAGSSVELTFGDRLIYCLDLPVIYTHVAFWTAPFSPAACHKLLEAS